MNIIKGIFQEFLMAFQGSEGHKLTIQIVMLFLISEVVTFFAYKKSALRYEYMMAEILFILASVFVLGILFSWMKIVLTRELMKDNEPPATED